MMEKRGSVQYYRISQFLFLLGVFLKQFYLLPSGSFQIGDAFFALSFLTLFFFRNELRIHIIEGDGLFAGFVASTIIINAIYILVYGFNYEGSVQFHTSILYYIFNLFTILSFRQFCENKRFLKQLRLVLQIGMLTQLVIMLTKQGKYMDAIRYMGTFNDPNQCGFYLMASLMLIFLISEITNEGHPWIWYVIGFYVVMETSSTGMMLGMAIMLAIYIFIKIFSRSVKSAMAFLMIVAVVFMVLVLLLSGLIQLPENITGSFMYERIMEKFRKFGIGEGATDTGALEAVITDRCWDKLFVYPSRILYGAGEGHFSRFEALAEGAHEIHSTILAPLFYYGIFPCMLWLLWTIKQLHGVKRELWCVYIALFVESITLVHNRQPFFWMIFVLAGSNLAKKYYDPETKEIYDNPESLKLIL